MNPAGSLTNAKTKVRNLKNKRLTEFINKVAASIPDNISDMHSPVDKPFIFHPDGQPSKPKKRLKGLAKQFTLVEIAHDKHIMHKFQFGDDEAPLLFVRRHKNQLGPAQMDEVIDSYMTFKELTADAEEHQDEYTDPL